jgi:uncharacterized membrane-anchored protein
MPRGSKPGERRGGRKKGVPNKATLDVAEKIKALGCDPIEGMVKVAQMALEDRDLSVAGRMYSELAQYVAPKHKAIQMGFEREDGVKEIKITYE